MKPAFRSFKLEDIKELQELVAEHIDSVEPGLRLLDSRVLLGGATIDLVAHDGRGSLVLLALGFTADDEMLLRALEAYSWCLEYPDALRRLYSTVRVSAHEPPRVLFIAERVPDAFFRKIKHLRFQRADCLEFRFGLQFTPVDTARAGDAPEPTNGHHPEPIRALAPEIARPGPVTYSTNGADTAARYDAEAVADTPEAVLEGLRRPRESALSPQRREAPTRPPGDVDEWKVKEVREYLQREFPTAVIYDFYAHDRTAQMFHLQDSQGSVVHSAAVAEDLLEECNEAQLRAFLDKHKLARVLRQAGQAAVSVTKAGLKIERR
jgi:hypothetical protein